MNIKKLLFSSYVFFFFLLFSFLILVCPPPPQYVRCRILEGILDCITIPPETRKSTPFVLIEVSPPWKRII